MELLRALKNSFVTGLVLIVPVVAVALVVGYIFMMFLQVFEFLLLDITASEQLNRLITAVVALLAATGLITLLGLAARTFIGSKIEGTFDRAFRKVPLMGTIYDVVKKTSIEVLREKKFKEPVKIDMNGNMRPAFKTGNTKDGREVLYMPSSPNIANGFVIEADPGNVRETDEDVEEMLEKLLTAGFSGKEE